MYKKNYLLRSSDFDRYDRIRPSAVLDLFQDVAGREVTEYGAGHKELAKKNLIWVVLRTRYDVIKLPKNYDEVTVKTMPHAPGRADFDRDYVIESGGETLIKGTSKWCLINSVTRKIAFGGEIDIGEYASEPLYSEGLKKIPNFSEEGCMKRTAKAEFSSIDHNRHVNNIKYADFILDALQLGEGEEIKAFEIDYIRETRLGEEFDIFYKEDGGGYIIKCKKGGEDVFRAKVFVGSQI